MNNKELLSQFIVICMELQEEYLSKYQDFNRQKRLEEEFQELKNEILNRMN